ncbi:MAG: ABC-2 transporter permease [bacterium]
MRGLIRNNYYTIESTLYASIGIFIFSILTIIVGNIAFSDTMDNASMISLAFMGGFSSLSHALLQNNSTSKWDKFELTTPISKGDVIKSRYIVFALSVLVGIGGMLFIFMTESIVLKNFNFMLNLDKYEFELALAFSFLTLIPAISHPLTLIFGVDKCQIIFMLSVMLSLAYFIAPSLLFNEFNQFLVDNFTDSDLAYRLIMSGLSVVIFSFSYMISKNIYLNKDL